MRKSYLLVSALVVFTLTLAACGPQATPTAVATEPPAVEPPVETPTLVEVPAGDAATPTLVPPNLAGPEMALGKTWLYVDLSTLIAVPGDTYPMGRGAGTDNPLHDVTVDDVWMYQSEVTNGQYAYCVRQGICSVPNLQENNTFLDPLRVSDPVSGVNWDQARVYCEFVRGRLPTEAEWEMAAAWDPVNRLKHIYPWGDGAPTCALANFNNCVGKTTNVAQYPQGASAYMMLGGSGNAFEWVSDIYDPTYYRNSPAENPQGPETGERRSIRSGGYRSKSDQMPSAVRFFDTPNVQRRDLGFRCVVEDPTWFAPFCELVQQHGTPGPNGGVDGVDIPEETCPNPNITTGENCGPNNAPYTVVTYSPPGAVHVLPGGCNDGADADPDTYVCNAAGVASGTWQCTVPPAPLDPSCPVNYTEVGDSCVPDAGTDGECLPGFNYDPANQCCAATPGSDGAIIPLCPAGLYFSNSDNACVPWPVANNVIKAVGVDLKTCGPGDQPCDPNTDPTCDPDGCENNPPQCGPYEYVSGCDCVCLPGYQYFCN